MGVLSLVAGLAAPSWSRRPSRRGYVKALVATALGPRPSTVADRIVRRAENTERVADATDPYPPGRGRRRGRTGGPDVAQVGGRSPQCYRWPRIVGLDVSLNMNAMWDRRAVRDLPGPGRGGGGNPRLGLSTTGTIASCTRAGICGPFTWSITRASGTTCPLHPATAAERFGTFVPYGVLALFGIRPELILRPPSTSSTSTGSTLTIRTSDRSKPSSTPRPTTAASRHQPSVPRPQPAAS